jgi:peptide/nickel transport system substrate-binding protein
MTGQRLALIVAAGTAAGVVAGIVALPHLFQGATPGSSGPDVSREYNLGNGRVVHPARAKGGTLRMAWSDWDSLDPADIYNGTSWDFIRLYGRSLVMFAPKPGPDGAKLVPDLAESLGTPSGDALTWTYRLRPGLRFEDGTPIRSRDVKYAVERSLDKSTFPGGPPYLNDYLDLRGYTSPYRDPSPDRLGLAAIGTPDDRTIVFHLRKPYSGFDYLAMLPATVPVPQAKDTGSEYQAHVISSGPYRFETVEAGKRLSLVRNPYWNAATDPNRPALPDRIEVSLKVDADQIDVQLLTGDLDVDIGGRGLRDATRDRVLANPSLRRNADSAPVPALRYTAINPDVAPLDNIHCRKAVEYATNHTEYQQAYGGEADGTVATSLLPSIIPGAQKIDLYHFDTQPTGDLTAARTELADCGQPNGFATNLAYRDRPRDQALAAALQVALARVGIKLTLKSFPLPDYYQLYAGKPDYAKTNKLGLMVSAWQADWPDGFGFLSGIVDSRQIRSTGGNANLGVRIPEVDGMLDTAAVTLDAAAREKLWVQIDQRVMQEAVILPGSWPRVVLYRPPNLTNVYVSAGLGGLYDYVSLGVR